MAVGTYLDGLGAQRTLAESWDGTRWSLLPSPNRGNTGDGNALFGVSCAVPGACMAAGDFYRRARSALVPLIESGTASGGGQEVFGLGGRGVHDR
jgi:hypothetical protein